MSFTDGFDPNKTHADYALSNANRTVTADGTVINRAAISDWSKTSGKSYWEISVDEFINSYSSIGFCDQSGDTDYDKTVRTGWNESWGLFRYNANTIRVYHDGAYYNMSGTGIAWVDADIIGVAIDIGAGKAWFSKNNSWFNSGDPANGNDPLFDDATIIGNTISAAIHLRYSTTIMTACFAESQLTYSPPSGFSALDVEGETDVINQSMFFLF